jgi:hypothetical protein
VTVGGRWSACAAAALALVAGCARPPEWHAAKAPLMTRWARDVSPANARPEYPRPLMRREAWQSLNGLWEYAVTPRGQRPPEYAGRILVPYPIESALSGVRDTVGPARSLWYRRTFTVPPPWAGKSVLLHFEAVDWETHVWVNGRHIGTHQGGYDPFAFDITAALTDHGTQEVVVAVWDPTDAGPQPRGKQVRQPGGIFYTSVTGIWQTVWLEPVGAVAIRDYVVTTDIDSGRVALMVTADGLREGDRVEATLRSPPAALGRAGPEAGDSLVARASAEPGQPIVLRVEKARLWSPDDPYLYGLELRLLRRESVLDRAAGHVGMRKIAVGADERGVTRLLLNNRFVFQTGPLDQGYWPDGLYTAPTDSAMVSDLLALKAMGFNMLRKHVKVEPRTFYAACDRLGLLVWQDMPSASIPLASPESDRATDTAATRQFETELLRMVRTHRSYPSIVMWVPFNEGWGQYDSERIASLVREADPTRLVNHASGWYERRAGDVVDRHNYPPPIPPRPERRRAAVQGEFGGLGLVVKGHTWREGGWGYDLFGSQEALAQRFEDFYVTIDRARKERGLSAAVYTQTSDVETENNGILTYDRAETKIPFYAVRLANRGVFAPRVVRGAPIFVDSVAVALMSPSPGAEIHYTLDGTTPRLFAPVYQRPFSLTQTATVKARSRYADGTWSRVTTFGFAQVMPREALPVDGALPGLEVDYFEQDGGWRTLPAFDSLVPKRTSVTSVIGLASAPRRENFGLRFRGLVRIPATGVYGFSLSSDDGSRLAIDGQLVVAHDGIHGMSERSGWVALSAGLHFFELAYFQGCCGIGLTLEVQAPLGARGPLPSGWLFHQDPSRRRAAPQAGTGTVARTVVGRLSAS